MQQMILWWLTFMLIGLLFFPLSYCLFGKFTDRGWLFSKVIGLFVSGWAMWLFSSLHVLPFTRVNVFLTLILCGIANYGIYSLLFMRKPAGPSFSDAFHPQGVSVRIIVIEEILFFTLIIIAVYVIGFKPEAYGTEKFMDYGFMASMMRSKWMPPADPWFSGKPINYYYGCQYYATFLTKFTHATVGEGYTLMRACVTSMSVTLPFSLVYQLMLDRLSAEDTPASLPASASARIRKHAGAKQKRQVGDVPKRSKAPFAVALLAGLSVGFASNMHYVVYYIIPELRHVLFGAESPSYWFPDSTRYVGENPPTNDKAITEFPAYSNILGDIHAHYVNLIFVITSIAVAYAWALKLEAEPFDPSETEAMYQGKNPFARLFVSLKLVLSPAKGKKYRHFLAPEVIVTGIMTGLFRWTNFWDFPIYYVTCGSVFFFFLLRRYWKRVSLFIWNILLIAAVMFGAGHLAALPFISSFEMISSEIRPTHSHTSFFQLSVLWALPLIAFAVFSVYLLVRYGKVPFRKKRQEAADGAAPAVPETHASAAGNGGKKRGNTGAAANPAQKKRLPAPDLAAFLFGMCGAGLILLPELIYVVDIYEADYYRTNTMFKLSYQAFILLGIFMAYAYCNLFRDGIAGRKYGGAVRRALHFVMIAVGAVGIFLILLCSTYTPYCVKTWFGDISDSDTRVHTDASVFISQSFPSDLKAINYMNTYIPGQPVILEAPGGAYTDYERVSVTTGLPTIGGWHTHEWLWRGDPDEITKRHGDADTIYTSDDPAAVISLIREYGISYIYVGRMEHERYPDNLNESMLRSIGTVVYDDGGAYIVDVRDPVYIPTVEIVEDP